MLAVGIIAILPLASTGQSLKNLKDHNSARSASLREDVEKVVAPVKQVTDQLNQKLNQNEVVKKLKQQSGLHDLGSKLAGDHAKQDDDSSTRQAAQDPQTTPPLNGTNPHGQGTVAAVDLAPSTDRPQSGDTTGKDTGEEVVLGRARGEQNADGTYHGHITIVGLLGNEILGVDSTPGQTQHGPLNALQTSLLDAICDGSGNQICLTVLAADSATTDTGSTNHFAVADATIGGQGGLHLAAAESNGNISSDATCQTSTGSSQVTGLQANGGPVVDAAEATATSKACAGQAPQQTNTSKVIGLGGTGIPLPAAGCADGTPDTVGGIPVLLPLICNADDQGQAAAPTGVREALDIFAVSAGSTTLLKTTAAAAESHAVAPAGTTPACADGVDNDGDGLVDLNDPGCSGPDDTSEGGGTQCSDGVDNDGDGQVDFPADKGCSSANDDSEAGGNEQCQDGVDNDNDGLVDFPADSGCSSATDNSEAGGGVKHSSRNGNKGAACNDNRDNDGDGLVDLADPGCSSASDNSEGGGGAGATNNANLGAGGKNLPFTGTDVVGLALAGLLALGSGLALRRRMQLH